MEHNIYFLLIVATCVIMFTWGISRPDRVYQYPFIMAVIFITFLLPQIIALTNSYVSINSSVLDRVLFVSWLCITACCIGYCLKPNIPFLIKISVEIDDSKLTRIAFAYAAIGNLCIFLLSRINIQYASNGNWTGPATILYFFTQLIFIALGIFSVSFFKKPSTWNTIIFFSLTARIFSYFLLNGRRQPTMTLIVLIGFSAFIIRRYTPPRWLIILASLSIAFLIPVYGALRGDVWQLILSGNFEALLLITRKSFESLVQGQDTLEMFNAALLIDAAETSGEFGYGSGYWDSLIFQFIPGQIIGFDFKESLQFKLTNFNLSELYGYTRPNGSTSTGIADSFLEFGYFGCLCFAAIAYLFKNLWVASLYFRSPIPKLLFMGLISPAMVSLTHGVGRFLQEFMFQCIFIYIAVAFSKSRGNKNFFQ